MESLPHELSVKIFSYLNARELGRAAQVSKHFRKISNDGFLWRKMYKRDFTYDQPLMHPDVAEFWFVPPNQVADYMWKSSYQQLFNGVHIKPGCGDTSGSLINYFENFEAAFDYLDSKNGPESIIFLHAGLYEEEDFEIRENFQLIGCASGKKIAESVIIKTDMETMFTLAEGAGNSYIGYITLKHFAFEHHCLIIYKSCPVIDHCIVRSGSVEGAGIYIYGLESNPIIKNCLFTDCDHACIFVSYYGRGIIENNEFADNYNYGILVTNYANPIVRRNTIRQSYLVGVGVYDDGLGYFEGNYVYSNYQASFEVKCRANPTVVRCEIHHNIVHGIDIHDSGLGHFENNRIFTNQYGGVRISSNANPTFKRNKIYREEWVGIRVVDGGRGIIEHNDIYENKVANILIVHNSNPVIQFNRIHHGGFSGITMGESKAMIESNKIFKNGRAGIRVTYQSDPIIRNNIICQGRAEGVWFLEGSTGILEANDIYSNAKSGVKISDESHPILKRNRIHECRGPAIEYASIGAKATLEDNHFYENGAAQ